jgi:short subunit dehydrogenase-like uncharacterized protein
MSLLIYGAYGYSGELIARRAVERGLRPVLAGRRAEALTPLAAELELSWRAFSLDDPAALDRAVAGSQVVLNCAGPFTHTAVPMVDACLRARAHYLDITGEVSVFAALAGRDAQARAAGVMVLPGAGFDVVPSDCLAAHLHHRLPDATHLRLAFRPSSGPSRGTALTTLEGAGRGGMVRRDGILTPVPLGHRTIDVDFGPGAKHNRAKAIAIPWGDVFTAGVTTGIPNVEVYIAVPWSIRAGMRLSRPLAPLLASAPIQRLLAGRLRSGPAGPSAEARRRGRCLLWGDAHDGKGRRVVSRMITADAYEITVLTSVALAQRALDGQARPGFQTPAGAYGRDFVLEFPGTVREDVS